MPSPYRARYEDAVREIAELELRAAKLKRRLQELQADVDRRTKRIAELNAQLRGEPEANRRCPACSAEYGPHGTPLYRKNGCACGAPLPSGPFGTPWYRG